jgi:acetyltransferase-like isoleucine patch superfamily enzyme
VIHASAVVADDAVLGAGACVGPFVVVGVDGPTEPPVIGERATIRSHSVIYRGVVLGSGVHIGHGALVREGTEAGNDVSIGSGSVVEHHVRLADGVRLHSGCFVPEHSVLHEGAWLGPGVVVTNARYPNRPETKANLEGVEVGPGAAVGAAAVLLPGVTIGEEALVGAGAVVVEDVPAGATVAGNPGRPLR